MGEPKIQHYVPVLNLNGFTNTDSKLFVYDKANNNVFETKVDNIPCEDSFCDGGIIHSDYLEDQYYDNYYSSVESEFAPFISDFIQKIASCKEFHISEKEKETISTFLSLQIDRTTEFQHSMMSVSHSFSDKFAERRIRHEYLLKMGFDLHNLNPKDIHLYHQVKGGRKSESFAEIIKKYSWFIVVNETDIPFYTSDNPIIMKENIFNASDRAAGCATKGIELIYPLTSKYLLVLRDIEFFKDCESLENNMLLCSKYDCVRYYNSLEFLSSYRQIYSSEKSFKIITDLKNRYSV